MTAGCVQEDALRLLQEAGTRSLDRLLHAPIPVSRDDRHAERALRTLVELQSLVYELVIAPDPGRPQFVTQFGWPLAHQALGPCPDFRYRLAFLDGRCTYRLHGNLRRSEWVIGELSSAGWCEDGARLLSSFDVQDYCDEAGDFDLLLGPDVGSGGIGLDADLPRQLLALRDVVSDWTITDRVAMGIDKVSGEARPSSVTERVRRAADILERYVDVCAGSVDRMGLTANGPLCFHRYGEDDLWKAEYATGLYQLRDGDEYVLELRSGCARYWSVHLSDCLMNVTDQVNAMTKVNHVEAETEADGVVRIVIAPQRPSSGNWLDCSAVPTGLLHIRWYGAKSAPSAVNSVRSSASGMREVRPIDDERAAARRQYLRLWGT